MALSADEVLLIERIHAEPEADGPRLAYAEWLERRGDPRGEFIRLDIEWPRMNPSDPRYAPLLARRQELLDRHQAGWVQPLLALGLSQSCVDGFAYTRGLVEDITLDCAAVFPEQAEELFEALPGLAMVRFQEQSNPDVGALAKSPWLGRLKGVGVCGLGLEAEAVRVLVSSPHLGRLRWLDLGYNKIGDEGVRALVESPALVDLEALHLSGCKLTWKAMPMLAGSGMGRLAFLTLNENALGPVVAESLARAPFLSSLRSLELELNDLGPEGVEWLSRLEGLSGLTRLNLPANSTGPDGAVARSPHLRGLTYLNMNQNELEDEGVEALATSPGLPDLAVLSVINNEIGPASARALAGSPHRGRLTELYISANRLGDEGVAALCAPDVPFRLQMLNVIKTGIGDRSAVALARSPHVPGMDVLWLGSNTFGAEGVEALAAVEWPVLRMMSFRWDDVDDSGKALLRERLGDRAHFR
jgi:uncharacterized protein (TIGR02996 family)